MPRLLPILLIPFILGGCALPVQFQIASLALDGFLYLTTEKSLTDHGLSKVTGKDCALHRIVTEEGHVCHEVQVDDTAIALAPPARKQMETFSWQNDQGAPLTASVPLKAEPSQSEASEKEEVVDLWSNDVPPELLPDGYRETLTKVGAPETTSASTIVPVLTSVMDLPDMAAAAPKVVDLWSNAVPDTLLEKTKRSVEQTSLSLAEVNHIY